MGPEAAYQYHLTVLPQYNVQVLQLLPLSGRSLQFGLYLAEGCNWDEANSNFWMIYHISHQMAAAEQLTPGQSITED
jgi:hypothetical protein